MIDFFYDPRNYFVAKLFSEAERVTSAQKFKLSHFSSKEVEVKIREIQLNGNPRTKDILTQLCNSALKFKAGWLSAGNVKIRFVKGENARQGLSIT